MYGATFTGLKAGASTENPLLIDVVAIGGEVFEAR